MFAVAALAAGMMAPAQSLSSFRTVEPTEVILPLMTDSVDPHGKKFEVKSLLPAKALADIALRPDARTVDADTAGLVILPSPTSGYSLVQLAATLRPERYAKGALEIECTEMVRVFVDGVEAASKLTFEDSISPSSKLSANLVMLPQAQSRVSFAILADSASEPFAFKARYVPDSEFEDVAVACGAEPLRRYELSDMGLGRRVTGTSISPDGKYMIVTYTERFSGSSSRTWRELVDLKTRKVINANLFAYSWMPKGSRLYYTMQGAEGYDVFTVDVPSMQETLVASNVPDASFTWSPTEDYMLYYKTDKGVEQKGPLRRYRNPDDHMAGNRSRYFLQKYDLATKTSQTLVFGSRSSSVMDIRPDGKAALLAVYDYDATEWPFYFTSLYELDLASLATDTLVSRDSNLSNAIYSPDGKQLFIAAAPDAFDGIGLNCGDHPIANSYDLQGYIFDIATKQARAMTRDFNPSLCAPYAWNAANGKIYFRGEEGFGYSVFCLDPASGSITKLPQEISWVQSFSIGNDEDQWLSSYGQSGRTSGRAYLYNLKSDKLTLYANPWAPRENAIDWGQTTQWNFTASDGSEIEGYITLPPDFDPSKKYPMIVYYYGGTSPTAHNTYSPYNAQVFASRGYVVYQLNPSGTTGYGQEFSARHVNAWGKYTADDIIEGVKKICAEHDFIDADKIGAIGASYGGFMTEYLTSVTDIFAAAVSHAGISNVTSYWGVGNWGYSYNAIAAAKSYPWTDPELFSQSALFNADKINTPLLMMHGLADNNVPVGESFSLFKALKILGKEAELVTVDGEDHYISGYDNRIKWQNTIMAWFAKWLQDDPRWWDALYPAP